MIDGNVYITDSERRRLKLRGLCLVSELTNLIENLATPIQMTSGLKESLVRLHRYFSSVGIKPVVDGLYQNKNNKTGG